MILDLGISCPFNLWYALAPNIGYCLQELAKYSNNFWQEKKHHARSELILIAVEIWHSW